MARANDDVNRHWLWGALASVGVSLGVYLVVGWFLANAAVTPECTRVRPTPAELGYPDAQLLSWKRNLG